MPPAEKSNGPFDRLKAEAGGLLEALADRATSTVRDKVEETAGRLTDYVDGGAGPGLTAALTGAKSMAEGKGPVRSLLGAGMSGVKEKVSGMFGGRGKGRSGGKQKLKLTNIVESVDVGVPVRVAYNQWTQYKDFPTFTKKVENAEPGEDGKKVHWKAQIFWSHREWDATIIDQRPDERIIWRSKGQKGHVDGAVTFHEIGPNLTRILLVMEYHPQGLFERTGNLWRAQGRRARLELKHFRRHVMAHTLLNPDGVEGWRGTIEDGEIVKDHDTAVQEESQEQGEERDQGEETEETEQPAGEFDEEPDEEPAGEEPADEADEADEEPHDEDEEPHDEEPADEADDSARGGARPRRGGRTRSTGRTAARAGRSRS